MVERRSEYIVVEVKEGVEPSVYYADEDNIIALAHERDGLMYNEINLTPNKKAVVIKYSWGEETIYSPEKALSEFAAAKVALAHNLIYFRAFTLGQAITFFISDKPDGYEYNMAREKIAKLLKIKNV